MICPSCGSEVFSSRFCENCGAPLPAESAQSFMNADPYVDPTDQMPMVDAVGTRQQAYGEPYQVPYQEQGAYYGGQPQGYPYGGPTSGSYQGAQQFTGALSPAAAAAAGVGTVSNTAFVLAIVGLILVVTGIGLVIGLGLCIAALVVNAKNNKLPLDNPHKTSTNVMSIIGIVLAALGIIFTVLLGALVYEAYDEGVFDEDFEVEVDEDTGKVTIGPKSQDWASVLLAELACDDAGGAACEGSGLA